MEENGADTKILEANGGLGSSGPWYWTFMLGFKGKSRSQVVKGVKSKREVVSLNMNLKMRDEKKHQKKLKRRSDYCKM